ncbi:hypothetical protein OS189_09115 [Sulfitobacter sp. F26169L]|uniref:hypothetical protein n=1 Tax=Sulfitobacter sp. F26169L TaxID=2996015 RepID=UPI002260F8C0|nr:hypothetical protein [Sulfitobacter sp. F26169L]MCX7566498.1 hypothetical protein [Sulfitobacter sp. F26169L]
MKRLTLIAFLMGTSASAQSVGVFFVPKDGSGVVQRATDVTLEKAEVIFGEPRPEGDTGVVLNKGGNAEWTDRTSRQVNERFGGEGKPFIVHREGVEPESAMEYDAAEEKRDGRPMQKKTPTSSSNTTKTGFRPPMP